MKLHRVEQRSDEWFLLRLGLITASEADCLYKKGNAFVYEKVAEIISGVPKPSFSAAATDWGIEYEPMAISQYEQEMGWDVSTDVGFITNYSGFGYSPDGIIVNKGRIMRLIEVKCPYNSGNHIMHMMEGPPLKYIRQMQFGMWVSDVDVCDFVSYDPRCKGKELTIQEIEREPGIEEKALDIFERIDAILDKLGDFDEDHS